MSSAEVVRLLKGYSGRLLFLAAEHKLKKFYWLPKTKRSLCGDGKFIASVGHITLEKAKEYVEKQKAHHAKATAENPHPSGLGSFKLSNPKIEYNIGLKQPEGLEVNNFSLNEPSNRSSELVS
jgi:hypothetical protein